MIETESELREDDALPPPAVEDGSGADPERKQKHAGGLLAIGIFKLSKAVFFFALGMGTLHLVHKNLGDVLLRAATILHQDPEGRLVSTLQDKADLVSGHQLRQVSTLSVGYSVVSLTEGIGLMLEKTWAEYLTLILTTGALPWEMYEIFKRPTAMRFSLLFLNLIVLAYLLWYVRKQRRLKQAEA